jgi:hypothetical protein
MEKDKKKKTFGDLKIGDSIYLLNGLEVKELKITKISNTSLYENSVCLETDGGPDHWYVGKSAKNSYENTIFVDPERAMEVLKEKATRRYSELQDKIDQEIIEFEKLEKFLYGKEKEVR